MFTLLISIIFYQGFSQNFICENAPYFEGEIMIPLTKSSFLIGRNSSELTNNFDIDFDLLKPVFRIETLKGENIIQILYIESQNELWKKQFCRLILYNKNQYKISCLNGFRSYLVDNQFDFSFSNEYQLSITNKEPYICEDFFYNNDFGFLVICFTDASFKLEKINQRNESITYLLFNHTLKQSNLCRKLFKRLASGEYNVIYLNCSEWTIYQIIHKDIRILLDKEILSQLQPVTQDQIPHNINYCFNFDQFILVFENSYYLIKIQDNNLVIVLKEYYSDDFKIYQATFSETRCSINYKFFFQQLDNHQVLKVKTPYKESLLILSIEKQYRILSIHQLGRILVLLYENKIQLIVNHHLIQNLHYTLTQLIQLDNTKYFAAIESNKPGIIFFENNLNQLAYLQNSKQQFNYLQFQRYGINLDSFVKCQIIKTLKQQNYDFIAELSRLFYSEVVNAEKQQCQTIRIALMKNLILSNHPVSLSLNHKFSRISDSLSTIEFCNANINFTKLAYQLTLQHEKIVVLRDNNITTFVICRQNKQITFNISFRYLIVQQSKIVLISNDSLFIFETLQNVYLEKQFQFFEEIQTVYQAETFVFITLLNSTVFKKISIFNFLRNQKVNNTFPFSHQNVLFYYEDQFKNLVFIQRQFSLFIQQNEQFFMLKLSNLKIIYIRVEISQYILFLGIPDEQNAIQKYYVINQELVQDIDLQLFNFTLVRPIKQEISQNYLAISAIKNQRYYVLIYKLDNPTQFQLREVIQVGKLEFALYQDKFTYVDHNFIVATISLKEYIIKITREKILDAILLDFIKIGLLINSTIQPASSIVVNLSIETMNTCLSLLPQQNTSIIQFNNSYLETIHFHNFIRGFIDDVEVLDTEKAILKGPLLFSSQQPCYFYENNLCLKLISSEIEIQKSKFFITNIKTSIMKDVEISLFLNHTQSIAHVWPLSYYYGEFIIIQLQGSSDQEPVILSGFEFKENIFVPLFVCEVKMFYQQFDFYQKYYLTDKILFRLQQNNLPIYYMIVNNTLLHQELPFTFLDVIPLGNERLYIFVRFCEKSENCMFQFDFQEVKNDKFCQVSQYKVLASIFYQALENIGLKNFLLDITSIKLISYSQLELVSILKIMIITHYKFSLTSEIKLLEDDVQMQIVHIIRNYYPNVTDILYFTDGKYLILNFQQRNLTLYDLRENKMMIEPIKQFEYVHNSINNLNTTHYIFYFHNFTVQIGELGYKIQLINLEQQQTEVLFRVSNQISTIEFNVTFSKGEKDMNSNLNSEILFPLCVIIIVILLIFYLRRIRLLTKSRLEQQIA